MVENIWIRGQKLANAIGLLCAGVGILIIGYQMLNKWVLWLGIFSTSLFAVLCIVMIFLSIRDAIFRPKDFFVKLHFKI